MKIYKQWVELKFSKDKTTLTPTVHKDFLGQIRLTKEQREYIDKKLMAFPLSSCPHEMIITIC
jgi:hypothetical protein